MAAYESLELPALLEYIKTLGNPDQLDRTRQGWQDMATELTNRIGVLAGPTSATLNGLLATVAPHWKGSGAEAYGQHFNDLSNYGMDVAARASIGDYGAPTSNFYTFHSQTDDALNALKYVKEEAATIQPLTDGNAKSEYVNSLNPQERLAVTEPTRYANPARDRAIQQAVTNYQTAYNEQLRGQALQLLTFLGAAYTSIADNMPTKTPGNPPGLHDTSTSITGANPTLGSLPPATLAPGGQPPSGQLAPGRVPAGQLPRGQLPTGHIPTGHIPGQQALNGQLPNGSLPASLTGALPGLGGTTVGTHPLAASGLGTLPPGTLPPNLNPNTQLANFTPQGALPGGGFGSSGLLPFNPASSGSLPGLSGLPGGAGFSPGGQNLVPSGGALPGSFLPGGLAAAGAGLGPRAAGLTGASRTGPGGPGGLDLPGLGGIGANGSGLAADNAVAGRAAAAGQAAADETAAAERATVGGAGLAGRAGVGGMPMMPFMPMSPMGGQGVDGRERRTWLDEDDDVWNDDTALLAPPVIGRIA